MDVLPSFSIFQELQIVHETGYFSALPSLEETWQQVHIIRLSCPSTSTRTCTNKNISTCVCVCVCVRVRACVYVCVVEKGLLTRGL